MNNNMGQFSGDMDRNEVEIDLNKFMALLQEKSELKDRIRELEDINNVNPYQKFKSYLCIVYAYFFFCHESPVWHDIS